MQVEEAPRLEPERKRAHLSPAKAFGLLAAVLVAAGAVLYLTRPDAKPAPTGIPESDNFALTNTEALARFEDLDEMRLSAIRDRDPAVIDYVLTSDSPLRELAERDIRKLIGQGIRVVPNFTTRRLSVTRNEPDSIVVRQWVIQRPRFFSEGKDVSATHEPLKRTIDWTMRIEAGAWKLHASEVVFSKALEKGNGH